jgi:Dolichyl-phosphate-mannose-protein mannosyltransferase
MPIVPVRQIRNQLIAFIGGITSRQWLGILGLALLFVALRWNNLNAPLTPDEGEYAYSAQLLTAGVAPYQHAFIQKPPMIIYSYALSHFLFSNVFWGPRILAGLFVALTTGLLGWIARMEFGKGFAWPAMWLATPMILQPGLAQFAANTEIFLLLPLLAMAAVYVSSRQHGHKPRFFFAGAFLGVTTLLYKYTAMPLVLFLWANWLFEIGRRRDGKLFCRNLAAGSLGAVTAALAILGYFLIQDGGAALWECTVRFNHYYLQTGLFGLKGLKVNIRMFWDHWWILFFIPCAALIRPKPRAGFWFGMWFCAWLCTGGSWLGQYYVLIMPFWALLLAAAIESLAAIAARRLARPQKWIQPGLLGVVMIALLLPDFWWLTYPPEKFAAENLTEISPLLVAQPAARLVAELTSANDFVCVAGSDPEILCYARRRSPTRFITAYALIFPSPFKQGYQQEMMRDLLARPPAMIVLTSSWLPKGSPPSELSEFLKKILAEDYDRIGGYIVRNQSMDWSEPLADQDAAHASLVLFKRKISSGETPAAVK